MVTCIDAFYSHAVTRGKSYQVAQVRGEQYRIIGDHGRRVFIHRHHFVEGIVDIPHVIECRVDRSDDSPLMEMEIRFSDGSWRWCLITTAEKLAQYFAALQPKEVPSLHISHLIILRDIEQTTIEYVIKHMESRNELDAATIPGCNPDEPRLAGY